MEKQRTEVAEWHCLRRENRDLKKKIEQLQLAAGKQVGPAKKLRTSANEFSGAVDPGCSSVIPSKGQKASNRKTLLRSENKACLRANGRTDENRGTGNSQCRSRVDPVETHRPNPQTVSLLVPSAEPPPTSYSSSLPASTSNPSYPPKTDDGPELNISARNEAGGSPIVPPIGRATSRRLLLPVSGPFQPQAPPLVLPNPHYRNSTLMMLWAAKPFLDDLLIFRDDVFPAARAESDRALRRYRDGTYPPTTWHSSLDEKLHLLTELADVLAALRERCPARLDIALDRLNVAVTRSSRGRFSLDGPQNDVLYGDHLINILLRFNGAGGCGTPGAGMGADPATANFMFTLRKKTRCEECGQTTDGIFPMKLLTLDTPHDFDLKGVADLQSVLKHGLVQREVMDGYGCTGCSGSVAVSKSHFKSLPRILRIHLQRRPDTSQEKRVVEIPPVLSLAGCVGDDETDVGSVKLPTLKRVISSSTEMSDANHERKNGDESLVDVVEVNDDFFSRDDPARMRYHLIGVIPRIPRNCRSNVGHFFAFVYDVHGKSWFVCDNGETKKTTQKRVTAGPITTTRTGQFFYMNEKILEAVTTYGGSSGKKSVRGVK